MAKEEMTNEDAIMRLKQFRDRQGNSSDDNEAFDMAIKSIKALDKLDSIIVEQLDKSTDFKECMTLRWVLDKIAEVK